MRVVDFFQRYEVNSANQIIGQYEAFHENGKRSMLLNYEEGKPVGEYSLFCEEGVLKEKGKYGRDGKKTGDISTYYKTGELESTENQESGKYEEYYKSGQIKTTGF